MIQVDDDMSTKTALRLIQWAGLLVLAIAALARQDILGIRLPVFVIMAILVSVAGMRLMVYALFRERRHGDKSVTVSGKTAVMIIYLVCVLLAFCFYRMTQH